MLIILIFNILWGAFCLLEKSGITSLLLVNKTSFEMLEIWFAVALVVSFFVFALIPKRDKKVENYTCPHCGATFKGGLKPTFCQVCKATIEQPKIDSKNKYYKG